MKSAESAERKVEKADALEEAFSKLNKIVDDHPSTDLAVKLISGQRIGGISLEIVASAAWKARDHATIFARAFEKSLKAAERGDADAQFTLSIYYRSGTGVPVNAAEAVKWYCKAAEQGYVDAQLTCTPTAGAFP